MLFNLSNLIEKYDLKIEGIIHIGAHHGTEYKSYLNLGIENCLFIEPLKHNYEVLIKNVPEEKCINIALGHEEKQVEMFVEYSNASQSSSILQPKLHLEQYPHIKFVDKQTVQMKKLDNITINPNINMINIDVQGYELKVFQGASKTLLTIDYIICEVNRADLYLDCCLVEEIDSFLGNYGFTRVETTWDGGNWGDALYMKTGNSNV